MKKIFPLLLLCTAIAFTACSSDDDKDEPIAVTGVVLDQSALSLGVGKTATLVATISPEDAVTKEVTWSSSATDVATVADGVVTAVKAGDAIITVTTKDGAKTATCTVKVEALIEVNGIKVATGNLVADGANGAKIGAPTDGGLFFQFGSLVGWSTTEPLEVVVSPVDCTVTSWDDQWTGDPTTDDAVSGKGDPCRYYLKGTWRLPTQEEYEALFGNTNNSYDSSVGWSWDTTAKSATHTGGLTLPAAGYREVNDGSLSMVGTRGNYWNALQPNRNNGGSLLFDPFTLLSSTSDDRAAGLSVRCVQDASN